MRLLFVGTLFFLFFNSAAQKSLDYYVTTHADTVYGILKPNKSNYNQTKFKVKGAADYQSLPEGTLSYYDAYMDVQYSLIKTNSERPEFLKQELMGEISLYRSADAYFLINLNDSILKIDDRKLTMHEHIKSAFDLESFLSRCSILTDRDFKETFDDQMQVRFSGLYKLITKSNQCGDPTKAIRKKKDSFIILEVTALGGLGPIKPTASGNLFDYSNLDNTSTTQFMGRLRAGFPQRKNRFNIVIGYAVSSIKTTGEQSEPYYTGTTIYRTDYYNTTLDANIKDLSTAVEYCIFLTPKFSIYPSIGHSMVSTIIKEFRVVGTRSWFDNENTFDNGELSLSTNELRNEFEPSWFFGLGLEYNISGRLRSMIEFVQYTPTNVQFGLTGNLELQRNSLRIGLSFIMLK